MLEEEIEKIVFEVMCKRIAIAAASIRSMNEFDSEIARQYFSYTPSYCRECQITKPPLPDLSDDDPYKGKIPTSSNRGKPLSRRGAGSAFGLAATSTAIKETLRSTLIQKTYEDLMAALWNHLNEVDPDNQPARRFYEEFEGNEERKSPLVYWTSCRQDDRLKQILCQLDSDVHLGVISANIQDIGTGYSHVINGAPEGIKAAVDFAYKEYKKREQEIKDALLQIDP